MVGEGGQRLIAVTRQSQCNRAVLICTAGSVGLFLFGGGEKVCFFFCFLFFDEAVAMKR